MTDRTENRDLIDVAQDAVRVQKLHPGIYLNASSDEIVDIRDRIRAEQTLPPARKSGSYAVTDAPSFVGYLDKHGEARTEVWADVDAGTVRAVINAHFQGFDLAGHQDHTLTLCLTTTDDWRAWTGRDGKLVPQLDFAEFIEDHLPNFVNPSAADMLELAQTFQATTKVDFASSQRVKSGETQLQYQEEQNATAGKKGTLAIPDTFELALQPFEGSPAYKVQARFRYRIEGSRLTLGYRLTRPKDVRKAAFDDVVAGIAADTERAIWATT